MTLRAAALALLLLPPRAAASYPELRMDERIELVSALALLAGADSTASGFYEHPTPYARRLRRELGPYKGHAAVAALDARLRAGLTSLDLYQLALRLSPSYEIGGQLPQPLVDRLGGAEASAQFLKLLSRFSADADFPGFWRRSEAERAALVAPAKAQADASTARAVLEKYTGLPAVNHAVILSPEAEPVFAVTVPDGEGLLSVFGPERYRRGLLGRKFLFNLASRRTDLWRQDLQAQLARVPGAPPEIVREAAAAATARLLLLEGSSEMAELTLVKYARVGMPHLRALFDRLAAYEADRKRWPTIASFYPELARAYAADASLSDFSGGLEALWRAAEPLAVIASEPWSAAAKTIWPQAEVIEPLDALKKDFTGRHVVVAGTREENAWLRRNWDALQLPLKLSSGAVSWARSDRDARTYELRGRLGLVTVARHPTDRLRGALIFTAADAADVPALEPRKSNGLDFLVLDGNLVLKAGLYEKSLLPWRPK